jgi:hypothetical protein
MAGDQSQAKVSGFFTCTLLTLPLTLLPHSIILSVNQDRFIQRAVEASNAYSSILQAVQAAEDAAGQAQKQASRTWEVSF